jgi:mono/diheme cytochrome c family protein
MLMRRLFWVGFATIILLGLAACAPPRTHPLGATPIPTLIPVTEVAAVLEPTAAPILGAISFPARSPSTTEGGRIYATYCTECHGEDGAGLTPDARNFRDLDYMRGETPKNFYLAVTEGRGEMPSFSNTLNSDERWDVVFFVWRLSTSAATIDDGQVIYEQNCVACHGESGSEELLGASDFTDFRTMADLASRDMYLTLTQGRGSMPAWQSLLSMDERWAVIDYVRTFSYDPTLTEEITVLPTAIPAPTEVAGCSEDQVNPFEWDDTAAIQAGETIFQAQCAVCHGADAMGVLAGTPNFTTAEVNTALKDNSGKFFCSLTEGKGAMPAFGEVLSPEERWQALTYLGSVIP